MKKILIIGYGNTLREDDAIGIVVAEELSKTIKNKSIQIEMTQQLMPELADQMSQVDCVFFIDASAKLKPGEINKELLLCSEDLSEHIHHFFAPRHLLNLCNQLYNSCPETYLYSMGISSLDYKEGLTQIIKNKMPDFISLIMKDISEFKNKSL